MSSSLNANGSVEVVDAELFVRQLPAKVTGLRGRMTVAADRVEGIALEGQTGGGTVALTGSAVWGPAGRADLDLRGDGILVTLAEGLKAQADLRLGLHGERDALKLAGEVRILKAGYQREFTEKPPPLAAANGDVPGPAPAAGPDFSRMALDINVHSTDNVWIANRRAKIEAAMALDVGGTLGAPAVSGEITAILFRALHSRSAELKEGVWEGLDYRYDHAAGKIFIDKVRLQDPLGEPTYRTPRDTMDLPGTDFVDGLSIAMYPLRFIHTNSRIDVPTILYGKVGTTTFDFTEAGTEDQLDAVDHPVRMLEVSGATSVVGIFGMTGEFTGWFSDDSAAVPLRGKLKVLIGNVELQLIRWKKGGWNPPAS